MGLDCAGAQVGPVHVVGRFMMCNDHTKQAGPFARDGEQGWTGLLHHDLVAAHADGRVCRQQELKDRLLLLCELDSTVDNASSTTNDPGHASSVFLSAAERARSRGSRSSRGIFLYNSRFWSFLV